METFKQFLTEEATRDQINKHWKQHGAKIMQRLSSVDDGHLSGDGSIPQKPSIIDHQGRDDVHSVAYHTAYDEYNSAGHLDAHKTARQELYGAEDTDSRSVFSAKLQRHNETFSREHRPKIQARASEMLADPKQKIEVVKNTLLSHLSKIKPEYHGWVMREYAAGNIKRMEDIGSTTADALEGYHAIKSKPSVAKKYMVPRDINQLHVAPLKPLHEPYKDGLYELGPEHERANEEAMSHNIMNLHHTVARVPSHEMLPDLEPHEYTKIDEPHWTIVIPHTEAASRKYGAGTQWCTAAKNNNMFDSYNKKGKLSIFIPKEPKYPGEKYQMHVDHTTGRTDVPMTHDSYRQPQMELNDDKDEYANYNKIGLGTATHHIQTVPQRTLIKTVTPEEADSKSSFSSLMATERPSKHFATRMENEVYGQGDPHGENPYDRGQSIKFRGLHEVEHLADDPHFTVRSSLAFQAASVIRTHDNFKQRHVEEPKEYRDRHYIHHTEQSYEAAKRIVAKLANDPNDYVRSHLNSRQD